MSKPQENEKKQPKTKLHWQKNNEINKVWRRKDYKFWGLAWELIVTPRIGTQACFDFFMTWAQINSFMSYVVKMAAHIEHMRKIASDALDIVDGKKEKNEDCFTVMDELAMQRQFFCEILLCRHIENYLTYLSGLLYETYIQRPELLKSSEKVDIESILEQECIESIIKMLAEKKIESLSYASFSNVMEYIQNRIGLALLEDTDIPLIIKSIETRNIAVHNRCIINKRYTQRTGTDIKFIGKQKKLYIDDVEALAIMLGCDVKQFDKLLREKLRIKSKRFRINPYASNPKYTKTMNK